MKTSEKVSNLELFEAFPREYPQGLDNLADSDDWEANEETARYLHRKWEDISSEDLESCYNIALLFNPSGFHYFFPAFIRQTQEHPEENDLLIDSLIRMLGKNDPLETTGKAIELLHQLGEDDNKELMEVLNTSQGTFDFEGIRGWELERWNLFTLSQWVLIRKWLQWIEEYRKPELEQDDDMMAELYSAYEYVNEQIARLSKRL